MTSAPEANTGSTNDVHQDANAKLPHERDESKGGEQDGLRGARGVIRQAHEDIESGQKDTDARNQPGVEAVKDAST